MNLESALHKAGLGCVALANMLSLAAASLAQSAPEPRVARVQLQFKSGDQVVDVIEPGDLLTVLDEDEQSYSVVTYQGRRGRVNKANAVKLAEAVEIYDQLIRATPQQGRLYTQRAMAWWGRRDQQRALADFDRAIQLGYRAAHAFTSRGMFHAAVGNIDEALSDFGQAIESDPADEVPHINRAAVYMLQNEFERAIADYDAAVGLNPDKAGNYQQRAAARKLNGQLDEALDDYNRALELDPKHIASLMGRGYVYYQQQKHAGAVADYTAAIGLAPNSAMAYNNRGFNRHLLGDARGALADYDRALELAPNYGMCHQNKAWLLATTSDSALRDGAAAVKSALRACDISQYKDLDDLRALAASYAAAGQFDLAIGWQEKVVAHAADDDKPEEARVLDQFKDKKPLGDR
jgi:tetratricopeptide (TPR) repeat protein